MSRFALQMIAVVGGVIALLIVVLTFERPPVDSVQRGYRGLGMEELANPRLAAEKIAANTLPEASPPVEQAGQPASAVYSNLKVLGDVDANEFLRLMADMTTWVAPAEESCNYCHNPDNLADDSKYQFKVARRMIEMTQHINAGWKDHVAQTGVTCYACHRGQPVPKNVWFNEPPANQPMGMLGNRAGQNLAATLVGETSLPTDILAPFFTGETNATDIRVISRTALPNGNLTSIKQTEATYGLMMHISQSLGVNCTFCHNTRSFFAWDQSTPQRTTAWYGVRMTRDINANYLEPLKPLFPPHRLGPLGDVAKANCNTCHSGAFKPFYGKSLLSQFPALAGPTTAAQQPAAEQPAAPAQQPPAQPPATQPPATQPPAAEQPPATQQPAPSAPPPATSPPSGSQ
ncbi:MAG: photosynthetic reaction center cytochrome PufC [Xanthobacteraceae bacterium]